MKNILVIGATGPVSYTHLIDEIAKNFGSQVCVLAVDAKQTEKGWWCYLNLSLIHI